jgi:hypothetical protein
MNKEVIKTTYSPTVINEQQQGLDRLKWAKPTSGSRNFGFSGKK